ncbi:MAG: DUF4234 domain-containing protein [Butyrivibrio sp.]|nr:DUF4234 domain-containing protein [Butyrivibrio sp.]
MFCTNCGQEIPEGSKVCPNCGKEVESLEQQITDTAKNVFSSAEQEVVGAVNDVKDTFNGNAPFTGGAPLKTDRSLLIVILLSLVTCGIYAYYFIYTLARDVNIACEGDGEETPGLLPFILLSMVTCGIYALYWYYKLGNRLANNAERYGMRFEENGTTVLLWGLIGSLLCGVGAYVALYIIIKNTNAICSAYNRANGYAF